MMPSISNICILAIKRMNKGLPKLISSLSFLILVGIQVYVIRNYYEEKSKNFDMMYSRAVISAIENNRFTPMSDSLDIVLNKTASSYLHDIFDTLDHSARDDINTEFDSLLRKYDFTPTVIRDYMLDNKLDTVYKTYYTINEISLIDFNNIIPIYKNDLNPTLQEKAKGIYINSNYKEGNFYAIQYDYYVDFLHKRKVILSEMKGLLIMVLVTLSTVILTFVYTLISLQRQKKLTELKDDFINNISHEFKTPLSIIALATSSLKQGEIQRDSHKSTEIYSQLEKQNRILSNMIDNVIDVRLLDKKSILNERENVPLRQYFSELVASFLSTEAAGKNVEIVEEYLVPDGFKYYLDPVQFSRAIVNLLRNSTKYCAVDPVIKIQISLEDHLKIKIKDNGIGIKDKHEGNVFNKFFRADNPEKVKGLGLGLYIVKRIIENHHGSIQLESEWGKGTSVIIILPNKEI